MGSPTNIDATVRDLAAVGDARNDRPEGDKYGLSKVAVLLSTYNGEAFLEEQLDSLSAQVGVSVEVFVRDDGSTDRTLEILEKRAGVWPQLAEPIRGDNLGPAGSFLELLRQVPSRFDYFAFCDQDDVWLPDKLGRAVAQLEREDATRPALYCSSVQCVDKDLRPRRTLSTGGDGRFEHLLFENIAIGNTIVMNPAARMAVNSAPPTRGVIMHDWWCALVTSALGVVIYDDRTNVLYRQHSANVIGGYSDRLQLIVALTQTFWKNPRVFYPIHAQATEFLSLYRDRMDGERCEHAASLVASRRSFFSRIRFAFSRQIIRQRLFDALVCRALIVFGLY